MCRQYGVGLNGDLQQAVNELVDGVWSRFEVDPAKISVPFMIMAGENELGEEAVRQVREFDHLPATANKTKRITTVEEGAESHCQLNNFPLQQQITYDWFDELLRGIVWIPIEADCIGVCFPNVQLQVSNSMIMHPVFFLVHQKF